MSYEANDFNNIVVIDKKHYGRKLLCQNLTWSARW